jgi:hypothetical protein
VRRPAKRLLASAALVLSCGGKSVAHLDESVGSGEAGGSGAPESRLGEACESDFDCLDVQTSGGAVVLCSTSGHCVPGVPSPVENQACYTEPPLPPVEFNESRVYESPLCATGLCLLRTYAIDPANTMCTSRCATDADCAVPFAYKAACLPTEVYADGDTGLIVTVCMPPRPW